MPTASRYRRGPASGYYVYLEVATGIRQAASPTS
jgi:hypothetical protein